MPVYEYRCEQCGRQFEQIRRMKEAEEQTECPFCQSKRTERVLSSFSTGSCAAPAGSRFR